jgi:tRNA/rRNA methyltransferase
MITIILTRPQMAENIGAIARCMKNFSLTSLRIVKPRDGWPNPKAFAISAGADDVLQNAKVYQTFAESISDLTYLYAATARPRYMNKPYVISKELAQDLQAIYTHAHLVGIVFGPENNGLSNEEVNICNKILVIDNNQMFSSLNIAQAVCIVAYELFQIKQRLDLSNAQELCSKQDLEQFFLHLISILEQKKFFKIDSKREHMIQNIRNIFSRIDSLSTQEINTLRGIIVALSRSYNHSL